MKRFIFTQKIDFEIEQHDFIDRNKYPQQYLRKILQERVSDAIIQIKDFRETAKLINNDYMPAADLALQNYIANYEYAVNLAKTLGLLGNSVNYIDSSEGDKARKEHMFELRKKFPETGITLASECFSYIQPRPLHTFTRPKIKTDIAGIVVPIGHADHRDFNDLLWNIGGTFKEQLEEINTQHKPNIKEKANYNDFAVKRRDENIRILFHERFGIPVFESYAFAPGDRFNNMPVGYSMPWKETESSFGRETYIKFAFNTWIDKHFPKK